MRMNVSIRIFLEGIKAWFFSFFYTGSIITIIVVRIIIIFFIISCSRCPSFLFFFSSVFTRFLVTPLLCMLLFLFSSFISFLNLILHSFIYFLFDIQNFVLSKILQLFFFLIYLSSSYKSLYIYVIPSPLILFAYYSNLPLYSPFTLGCIGFNSYFRTFICNAHLK